METTINYNKIGGWLWLPALGLIVTPVSFIFSCILPLYNHPYPFRVWIDYTILNADFFLLILVGIVSWFFFKRKKNAAALYIMYILIINLLWNILDGIHESQNDPPFIAMLFYGIVMVPCFTLSKKVPATFTEELNKELFIEKFFMPMSSFLERFYKILAKSRYLIFLIMVLYLFFGIILNCVLRSLRIDGTIMNTFDYL